MTNATRCFSHVKQELMRATSLRQLNKSAEEIQKVGGFDNQNRLGKIYKQKAAEFKR